MTDKPFQENNKFTQVHNYSFDLLMPVLSANAFKALMFIVRRTKGMVDADGNRVGLARLSYPEIKKGTGIKHNVTLSNALKELKFFDLIIVTEGREYEKNGYSINEEHEAKSENDLLAIKSKYDVVSKSKSDVAATSESDGIKNKEKKDKERKTTNDNPPNGAAVVAAAIEKPKGKRTPKAPQDMTAHEAIIDAYVQELGYNPPNGKAMGTAAAWLVKNGYTPEQVRDCYRHFKAKPFYADKPLSLQTIRTNIPDFLRFLESQPAPSPTEAECLTALENVNKVIERDRMGNPIAQLPKYAAALSQRGETFQSVRGAWMKCKNAKSPVGAFLTWVRDNQMVVGVQGEEKVMYDDSGNKLILVQGIGWQQVSA